MMSESTKENSEMKKKKTLKEKILLFILCTSFGILSVLFLGYIFLQGLSGGGSSDSKGSNSDKEEIVEEKTEEEAGEDAALTIDEETGVIFIGDSRFVGMSEACDITDKPGQFVVAKVGQGYYWLTSDGLTEAAFIESSNTEYKKWKYVICLGINDLQNIEDYVTKYEELMQTKDITLVSVGPVSNYPEISNEKVEAFNERIKGLECDYIDYYSLLVEDGFRAPDGLHYDDATYSRIYEILTAELGITEVSGVMTQ